MTAMLEAVKMSCHGERKNLDTPRLVYFKCPESAATLASAANS